MSAMLMMTLKSLGAFGAAKAMTIPWHAENIALLRKKTQNRAFP